MSERQGWFKRLKAGLSRTSSKISDGVGAIFTRRKLDDETLQELEELLIGADLGPATAARLAGNLAKTKFGKEVSPEEIRAALAEDVATILTPVAVPMDVARGHKPHVILVVGVNGSGKTTTIGKLAKQFREDGKSVMLAAGDTFRAAAIEQLQIWGDRVGAPVIAKTPGADAAGLAFDAMARARDDGTDILLIDTAGRLHNKQNLMDELAKVVRVIGKQDASAPHDTLLVLDSTVGQNAHAQVEIFKSMVNISGLVMTKLDGTAKGGVVVGLADSFGLPVHAVGVGESADDLRSFDPTDFARSLMGLGD